MDTVRSAEIITVGTELLLGEIVDTNSAYLAGELAAAGVNVYWSLRVGDNLGRVREAIATALARSDLVLLTGGLGPTEDDLTREAIAAELGEEPHVDEGLEAVLRSRFAGGGRPMPERNLKQAWLIPSATALANPNGTAPGWLVRVERNGRQRLIVALPGPPRELMPMWRDETLPRLNVPGRNLFVRTFKTYGVGESTLADRLGALASAANPSVATYAKRDGVHVRVAAKGESPAAAEALAAKTVAAVADLLGESAWGTDGDELPALVISALAERGLSLASAEGASGGLLSQTLAGQLGSEGVYRGGVLAWSAQAMGVLGMPRPAQEPPSQQALAVLLAEAARETLSADIGLATLGSGFQDGRPVGAVNDAEAYVAVTSASEPAVRRVQLQVADVSWRRERVLIAALHLLWSQLR